MRDIITKIVSDQIGRQVVRLRFNFDNFFYRTTVCVNHSHYQST